MYCNKKCFLCFHDYYSLHVSNKLQYHLIFALLSKFEIKLVLKVPIYGVY